MSQVFLNLSQLFPKETRLLLKTISVQCMHSLYSYLSNLGFASNTNMSSEYITTELITKTHLSSETDIVTPETQTSVEYHSLKKRISQLSKKFYKSSSKNMPNELIVVLPDYEVFDTTNRKRPVYPSLTDEEAFLCI